MTLAGLIEAARRGRATEAEIDALGRLALEQGEEEAALPAIEEAARKDGSGRAWQWAGLLHRALDAHDRALEAFARAARLAPDDAGIAHGRAQVALEAGIDAVPFFAEARRLAPDKGDLLVGLAAALAAQGHGIEAADALDGVLARAPLWLQGHWQLAQLRSLVGQPGRAAESIERALAARPGEEPLWRCLFDLHLAREDHETLTDSVARARAAGQAAAFCDRYDAIAAAERGDGARADRLLTALGDMSGLEIWRIRHALRTGRLDAALRAIDAELATGRAPQAWPYAAAAWRMAGDPRSAWLEADGRLVTVAEIGPDLPPLRELAAHLRSLHTAGGVYLDQSVRGGTQTDGPLFSRIDPPVRKVRAAVLAAVARHVAALPPPDPAHPLLRHRRDRRLRFAGSWSVRLKGGGHHSNHVHPMGWISSALYVDLPPRGAGEAPDAGWLTLGEPQAGLGVALPATRAIEPKPGRLVLFPSWMWHGTRPFAAGERLTIAFDVAVPR